MNVTNEPPINEGDCLHASFNISSHGIWDELESGGAILGYSLPLLEMQVMAMFLVIVLTHMFLRCIGVPQIASHMIGGLILGPQLFDLREFSLRRLSLDPQFSGNQTLDAISTLASILFSFSMTVRTNRGVAFTGGKLPVAIALFSFLPPLFIGLIFRFLLTENLDPLYMPRKLALAERSVIITTQASTLLPTITHLLSELKILNSELGRLTLSAAVLAEYLGIFVIIIASFVGTYRNVSPGIAYRDAIATLIFFVFLIFIFKPAVEWIIHQTPEGKPVRNVYINAVIVTVFASSVFTTFFNLKYVLGPILIGLVIPDGPPLGSTLEAKFEKVVKNVLLPIAISASLMRADITRIFYEFDDISYNIFLLVLMLILKLLGALLPCLYFKLPLKESMAVAIITSSKGFSELYLYEIAREKSYLSIGTHSLLMLYVLMNYGIIPTIVNSLYDPKRKYVGFQKANIMHLKPNSNVRILTCLHRPGNISSAIGLLQLLISPNQDPPIVVTVLHLVKLVGRVLPVLISHSKKSKRMLLSSYIQTAMLEFSQFEEDNWGSLSLNMFTDFSHENMMHDDVCQLALDQSSSIIILPSGRKWTLDGSFDSDDVAIRNLNVSLLERAPCSIGILVDRGQFSRRANSKNDEKGSDKYPINVGVIFIGGQDDREALSLAKRMIQNQRVCLTVIRFVTDQETESTSWEYFLDYEVLKDLKRSSDSDESIVISYKEKVVNSGPEVARTVRGIGKDYDLMIVGRDHGEASPDFSGLEGWMEMPELGVIGDLLAARDLNSHVSVLVVQQQRQRA
ncbi:PREDICTED: cation/H(+) antiporter 10 [Tarenaya hassleriana]|uniref:cation/H(+) antiporter 10 n=1 Tax=Tarenaya hassleriana TaxID=28532 RepID=UPI00053C4838|nr:PREDICTED: cation/H(+) antiporter 10 [Tarenaya hassleriana]